MEFFGEHVNMKSTCWKYKPKLPRPSSYYGAAKVVVDMANESDLTTTESAPA
jgi:hypothetical protein